MSRYYGPRFYRVRVFSTLGGKAHESAYSFEGRRSEATAFGQREANRGNAAILETIDDRFPANVLSSDAFKPAARKDF